MLSPPPHRVDAQHRAPLSLQVVENNQDSKNTTPQLPV